MRYIVLVFLITVGVSCQTVTVPANSEVIDEQTTMKDTIQGEGTIVWNDFEGGFFGIQSKNGDKYYPLGSLDEEFQVDGLAVKFVLIPEREAVTFVMWGTPASVVSIAKLGEL
ncbi:MAG: hypothetical protein OXD43_01345 [Bacteroidetes bacterium]|nr:hypothetical protein [Bacteroidota bacterium]